MWAIMLANFNCQITMTRHLGAKRLTQERGAIGALPPNNHLGSYKLDALLLVYMTGYRILVALSTCKDIALSASVA